jgi:hypothetical protein
MGRRSRKRAAAPAATRAERDAARRARAGSGAAAASSRPRPGRPRADERPPAPWGKFPLSELIVLVGLVLMVWGFVTWDDGGDIRFVAGLVVAALGGLELSLREHLAGFRSHTSLLSGVVSFAVVSGLALGPGPHVVWALGLIALAVFGGAFLGFRELFKRRSGGLGFR